MLVNNNEIIGINPKFLKAVEFAKNVAVTKSPVLIVGESGTGKRTLCSYIHLKSARNEKPLLVVDCSKKGKEVENDILGYRDEDGKFHKGVLERANNGMVVFANIECLEEGFQKKLYTILSELTDYDLDIRAIATTTKNLSKYVGSGRFYRALFSFFSGTQITMPALRDRKEDLRGITEYYRNLYAHENNLDSIQVTDDALEKISSYYWAQNYNEFELVIENSVKNCENGIVDRNAIEVGEKKSESRLSDDQDDTLKLMSLKEAEKLLIKKALIHTSENRTQAAKILGVSIRTLRNKINEYRSEGTQYFVNLR